MILVLILILLLVLALVLGVVLVLALIPIDIIARSGYRHAVADMAQDHKESVHTSDQPLVICMVAQFPGPRKLCFVTTF